MRTLTAIFFLALFLLLRPSALGSGGFWYSDDDQDYFAHASSIAYGQFPHYEKEFFNNKGLPLAAVGPGILAAPFVFVFSLIDRITQAPVIQARTRETILHSWSLYGFMVATIFYFWLGCALLHQGLRRHFSSAAATWAVILMILCQGLPLFAFRRPVFSHIFEFFLQSSMVCLFLMSTRKNWTWKNFSLSNNMAIGLLCGLIVLVRYNNLLIALAWPIILARASWPDLRNHKFWICAGTMFTTAAAMILFFKIWPGTLVPEVPSYLTNSIVIQKLGHIQSPLFYTQRTITILIGLDWGLIFSAPFACIALVTMIKPRSSIDKSFLWLLAPLIVNVYCVLNWGTQGGWYGYRYLIASLFPLLVYPFARQLENMKKLSQRSWAHGIIPAIASLPLLSMICFEASGGHFNLSVQGDLGWSNVSFQHQVWKTFLFKPGTMLEIILAAGPTYIAYLAQHILFWLHLSVKPYFDKYPDLEPVTLIKTIFLYALPFLLHFIWRRVQQPGAKELQSNG